MPLQDFKPDLTSVLRRRRRNPETMLRSLKMELGTKEAILLYLNKDYTLSPEVLSMLDDMFSVQVKTSEPVRNDDNRKTNRVGKVDEDLEKIDNVKEKLLEVLQDKSTTNGPAPLSLEMSNEDQPMVKASTPSSPGTETEVKDSSETSEVEAPLTISDHENSDKDTMEVEPVLEEAPPLKRPRKKRRRKKATPVSKE